MSLLLDLVEESKRPALTTEEQERLTDYATTTRYPGDYEDISLEEARRATTIADRVRAEVREKLPREALEVDSTEAGEQPSGGDATVPVVTPHATDEDLPPPESPGDPPSP